MIQLESILNIAQGKIVCILDDHSQAFSNAKEAIESGLYKHCIVSGISVHDDAILLNLQPFQTPITEETGKWAEEYQKQFNSDPSFF